MQVFGADTSSVRGAHSPGRPEPSGVVVSRSPQVAQPAGFEGAFSRAASLRLHPPSGVRLEPGQTLQGRVVAAQDGHVTVSFGHFQMSGSSSQPLSAGQRLQVCVQEQGNGSWGFEVTRSEMRSPLTRSDLTGALLELRLPVTEPALSQARSLVEQGVPLTRENLQDVQRALASLPQPPSAHDLAAASFLKAGALPLSPANLATLSAFFAAHPHLGAQLSSCQQKLQRFRQDLDEPLGGELGERLERAPGLLGGLLLDVSRTSSRRGLQRGLQDLALQVGLGDLADQASSGHEDYVAWLRELCDLLAAQRDGRPGLAELRGALLDVAESLQAQRLINASAAGEQAACYLQIPLSEPPETAQARLVYHVEGEQRALDELSLVELVVPTRHLGDLRYRVAVSQGALAVEVAVSDEAVREHLLCYLPDLVDNLKRIGYDACNTACSVQGSSPLAWGQGLPSAASLVERVDVSA